MLDVEEGNGGLDVWRPVLMNMLPGLRQELRIAKLSLRVSIFRVPSAAPGLKIDRVL